jgi:phosphatidate cytidylyltransferase
MNNVASRFLLGFIAIPVLLIFLFLPGDTFHAGFNALVAAASFLGGREVARLLNRAQFGLNLTVAGLLSALAPTAAWVVLIFPLAGAFEGILLLAAALVLLPLGFPSQAENLQPGLFRFAGYLAVLVYPGLFLSRITTLSGLRPSTPFLLLFLAIVFCNDSFAYFAGAALGKNNRGLFKVSPKKSLAGLLGGLAAGVAAAWAVSLLFPELRGEAFVPGGIGETFRRLCGLDGPAAFAPRWTGGGAELTLLALITSLTAVAGDLIESALKRGAGVKDSGALLPGRGGLMDSLDSLLFSAPFYYYLLRGFFF